MQGITDQLQYMFRHTNLYGIISQWPVQLVMNFLYLSIEL